MKNKKIWITIIITFVLVFFIIFFFIKKINIYSSNELSEYTPEEELSDEEIRKTIICLYFKNTETNSLIAETKCIDVKNLYNDPYSYLINLLIIGPQNEKLESPIPEGTIINSCQLKGNTLYVDLSKEFLDNAPSGVDEESIIVYSIVNTLTELNEVTSVKFLINGEENLSFNDGAINFENAFSKND